MVRQLDRWVVPTSRCSASAVLKRRFPPGAPRLAPQSGSCTRRLPIVEIHTHTSAGVSSDPIPPQPLSAMQNFTVPRHTSSTCRSSSARTASSPGQSPHSPADQRVLYQAGRRLTEALKSAKKNARSRAARPIDPSRSSYGGAGFTSRTDHGRCRAAFTRTSNAGCSMSSFTAEGVAETYVE